MGSNPGPEQCEGAIKFLAEIEGIAASQVGFSDGTIDDCSDGGAWAPIPAGCSVSTSPDNTALLWSGHHKTGPDCPSRLPHQLVCSGFYDPSAPPGQPPGKPPALPADGPQAPRPPVSPPPPPPPLDGACIRDYMWAWSETQWDMWQTQQTLQGQNKDGPWWNRKPVKFSNRAQAQAACEAMGGQLPIILSQQQNDEIRAYIEKDGVAQSIRGLDRTDPGNNKNWHS